MPDEMETTAKKTGEVMVWRKLGLSERLKFVKYDATQNFPSHYDGAYVKSERLRSQARRCLPIVMWLWMWVNTHHRKDLI